MTTNEKYIVGYLLVLGLIMLSGLELIDEDNEVREKSNQESLVRPPSKDTSYQTVRHYDFEQGSFRTYTDEEIRMLRERESFKSSGTYIYTPGRHVPSREQEIENYLEDNPEVVEEIYDKYRD